MNTKQRVRTIAIAAAIGGAMLTGGSVLASHDHYLVTPGTCVEDIARGQTAKDVGEGGYHKFHENVHLGQPGATAFENPSNPVAVYKNGTGPGCS